jgi:putative effector of murein hydrolase
LFSFFSPLGVLLWFAWNFAVLASIQLTVRLIRAFSVRTTAVGALAFTLGSLPIAWLYATALRGVLAWYPLAMLLSGLLGFAVAHYLLHLRRLRGRFAAALGTAVLSGPWPLFFELLGR